MSPDQYCLEKIKHSGSSFYYSFYFLPVVKRRALIALYAFCREVDDVVDDGKTPEVARLTLNWWKSELDHLYAGKPQHPISRALLPIIHTFALQKVLFIDILEGMEMDMGQVRYANFKSLQLYCHRVAGVVGELTVHILGYNHPNTLKFAHTLGLAFQLTNIIRDVGEDAIRGRIYLPQDELQQFKVAEADILTGKLSPQFTALMHFQIQRAEQYYQQALTLLPVEDRRAQRVSLIMAAIYHTLLKRIQKEGPGQVLVQHIALTGFYKLYLALKAWLKN
jgi:phytoene synthase